MFTVGGNVNPVLRLQGAAGWREVLYAPGLLPIYSRLHDQIFLRPSVHKFYEFNSSFFERVPSLSTQI